MERSWDFLHEIYPTALDGSEKRKYNQSFGWAELIGFLPGESRK
jgi:hypothetical protein